MSIYYFSFLLSNTLHNNKSFRRYPVGIAGSGEQKEKAKKYLIQTRSLSKGNATFYVPTISWSPRTRLASLRRTMGQLPPKRGKTHFSERNRACRLVQQNFVSFLVSLGRAYSLTQNNNWLLAICNLGICTNKCIFVEIKIAASNTAADDHSMEFLFSSNE